MRLWLHSLSCYLQIFLLSRFLCNRCIWVACAAISWGFNRHLVCYLQVIVVEVSLQFHRYIWVALFKWFHKVQQVLGVDIVTLQNIVLQSVCDSNKDILESLSNPSLKGFTMECNGRFQFVLVVEKSWYSSTTSGYSYRYKDHALLDYNFMQICGRMESYAMWIRFLKTYVSKGFLGRVLVEKTFLVLENFQKW
jgi:hypothetical protein